MSYFSVRGNFADNHFTFLFYNPCNIITILSKVRRDNSPSAYTSGEFFPSAYTSGEFFHLEAISIGIEAEQLRSIFMNALLTSRFGNPSL